MKITAQFGNLEVVTIHVKNVKKFKFGHDLAHLPKAIRKFFIFSYNYKNPFEAYSVGQSEQTNHHGDPFNNYPDPNEVNKDTLPLKKQQKNQLNSSPSKKQQLSETPEEISRAIATIPTRSSDSTDVPASHESREKEAAEEAAPKTCSNNKGQENEKERTRRQTLKDDDSKMLPAREISQAFRSTIASAQTPTSLSTQAGINKSNNESNISQNVSTSPEDTTKPAVIMRQPVVTRNDASTNPSLTSRISKAISNFMNNTVRPRSKRKAPMPIRYR